MGKEHPPETVFRAQELYCVDRMTFAQVAKAVGVADSSVKRWSDTYGWQAKRDEIAQAEMDIRADFILARSRMLKALMENKDAQTGFAVASLEGLAMKQAEAVRQGRHLENAAAIAVQPLREIRTEADAVAALEEALNIRMGRILANPSLVDLKTVRELQQAMALVQGMRKGEAKGAARKKGLTPETTEAMRRKILGVES
jgi:transposase-like protein